MARAAAGPARDRGHHDRDARPSTSSTSGRQAAQRFGIAIDPSYRNAQGKAGADFQGVAVTYAQVAAHPALHRARTESRRTLVIFDEVHHAGDALSWGEAVREAFEPARRRLALTGTPFRSDANPIPFVTYVPEADGSKRSASDYVYGYGPALADGVVRPVIFLAYSGEMHWRTRAGDEITATLGTPDDQGPDRAGLADRARPVGRVDQPGARGRRQAADRGPAGDAGRGRPGDRRRPRDRARVRGRCCGGSAASGRLWCSPTTRPRPGRSPRSRASTARWMVAVRMVSEGVDVPRLAVGVYATSVSTALFFAQAVGRFVRVAAARRDRVGVRALGAGAARVRGRARGRARPRGPGARPGPRGRARRRRSGSGRRRTTSSSSAGRSRR